MSQDSTVPSEITASSGSENGSPTAMTEDTSDRSATNKEDTKTTVSDSETQQEEEVLKKSCDALKYVELSEETQRSGTYFTKCYETEEEADQLDCDWTNNHYLWRDMKAVDSQLFFTSYDVVKKDNSTCWPEIPRPGLSGRKKPKIEEQNDDVQGYMKHIRDTDTKQRFSNCGDDLDEMIPFLAHEDMPTDQSKDWDDIRNFIADAIAYTNAPQFSSSLAEIYDMIHKYKTSITKTKSELLVGFGHVRMVYRNRKHEKILVNGPLFEVQVEATMLKDGGFRIGPTADSAVTLNAEVMSALNAVGGGNSVLMKKLLAELKNTSVKSLRFGDADTYKTLLKASVLLRCRGEYKSADDLDVHRDPEDSNALVISDACCLFSRKKATTTFSEDARNLIDALDRKKLRITEPVRALVSGPDYLDRFSGGGGLREEDLVYTLPTSKKQEEVGKRLFVDCEPVLSLEGPPGTGKTHSIVNIAATAMSVGKTILVTSSNSRALRGFFDKFPEIMKALVLNMACCEEGGIDILQKCVEKLWNSLNEYENRKSQMDQLTKRIRKEKDALAELAKRVKSASAAKRTLFSNEAFVEALQPLLDTSWLLESLLTDAPGLNTESDIQSILSAVQAGTDSVTFEGGCSFFDDKEVFEEVKRKAKEMKESDGAPPTFKLSSSLSESEKKLKLVRIDGRDPKTPEDWTRILSVFHLRNEVAPTLKQLGCSEDEISCKTFPVQLEAGLALKRIMNTLDADLKQSLRSIVTNELESGRVNQNQYRTRVAKIQKLEADLLFEKVVASLNEKLDGNSRSALIQLNDALEIMNSQALGSSSGKGERSSRHREEFNRLFREAAKFMPILVMTTTQVSKYIPPDHCFDIAIIDEASQSNCTAITIMARSKQVLTVGDDKQVSPSQVGLSEERIQWLETQLPDGIPTAKKLGPESSFFSLFKSAFPSSSVGMFEHYRCDPRIIAISNATFYDKRLVPLRLPSKTDATEDIRVNGTRDKKKKTNEEEANVITDLILNVVKASAEKSEDKCPTIGVISLGGPEQVKRIDELKDEKLEPVITEFGSDVIDKHNILVGTPQQWQGDERDIVFLSTVNSPAETKRGVKSKMPEEHPRSKKTWNVALTRAKNKMVLCRSYGINDLKNSDFRQGILRKFTNQGKAEKKPPSALFDSEPLLKKVREKLSSALVDQEFIVEQQGGKIWPEALRVAKKDESHTCALILIENAGESEEDWMTAVDHQKSLEGAGRSCLRVDCLSLAINFDATFQEVIGFLSDCGFCSDVASEAQAKPSGKRKAEEAGASTSAKKSPRIE